MDKKDIRQKNLEQRMALSDDKIQELSDIIQDHVLKSPFWPTKGRVGIYSAIKNEVLTYKFFQLGLEQGLHVFFPRVEQGLHFYEVNGPEDLQRGAWAIPEPINTCPGIPQDEKLDLLIVPGIAFTKSCYRIGYGRGFYDRIIDSIAKNAIGVAYDFQILEDMPLDQWDKQLDALFTEKHIYKADPPKEKTPL